MNGENYSPFDIFGVPKPKETGKPGADNLEKNNGGLITANWFGYLGENRNGSSPKSPLGGDVLIVEPNIPIISRTLTDIYALTKPVDHGGESKNNEDREYSLYNHLENLKKYSVTIRPMVLEILRNKWSGEITLLKRELTGDRNNSKVYFSDPDDRIQFMLNKDDKGKVALYLRNKDTYPGEIKKTLKGDIANLTADKVGEFCNRHQGSNDLNVSHLREVIPKDQVESDKKKFLGLVGDNGEILGVACVLEGDNKSVVLHRLAVVPESQSRGIGGRIIEFLKEKYDVISLRPTPGGTVKGETNDSAENLRRYYKKRGFIPGYDYIWKKSWINLSDKTSARNWREVDEKSLVVFDNVQINGADVIDLFLRRLWDDKKNELSGETKDALLWWIKVKNEMGKVETDLRSRKNERLRRAGLI